MPTGPASLLILAIPVLLLLFMSWTQRRNQKALGEFQASLQHGDRVITTSGLFGTIVNLTDSTVDLEVSDGVRLTFDRRAIGMKAS